MARIQYEAKRVEPQDPDKPVFWVADPPRFSCGVNLNELKILIFPSRQREGDYTIIMDDPAPRRFSDENGGDSTA